MRAVPLHKLRRGCLSKVSEVNESHGFVRASCCGQREELGEAPTMRTPGSEEAAQLGCSRREGQEWTLRSERE